jgi:hypothetical protein
MQKIDEEDAKDLTDNAGNVNDGGAHEDAVEMVPDNAGNVNDGGAHEDAVEMVPDNAGNVNDRGTHEDAVDGTVRVTRREQNVWERLEEAKAKK